MQRMIFVNLPVADVEASTAFYLALGFAKNEQFSNDGVSYVVVEDNIGLMLHGPQSYARFLPEGASAATPAAGVAHLIALSAEGREEVDDITARAHAAGATQFRPNDDYGYMYGTSFTDPDGHVVEIVWMDVEAATREMAGASA